MDIMKRPEGAEIAAQAKYDELLRTHVPKYKFQSLTHLDALSHEHIFMSDPANFNDPFDLRIEISDETTLGPFDNVDNLRKAFKILLDTSTDIADHWFYDGELLHVLRAWADGNLPSHYITSAVSDRFRRFGVACFAPAWDMPLMWSHYGNSHKGFCVEYLVYPMSLWGSFVQLPVTYSSKLPNICLSEALFSPHMVLPRLLATKHVDWAYEKEWRLVHLEAKGKATPMIEGLMIGSLIIGKNASPADCLRILAKGVELNVPVYQIRQRFGSYDFFREVTWPLHY
jgi:hypothetical protein